MLPSIFYTADVLFELDGKLIESAGEFGILTGELGLSIDIDLTYIGVKLTGLMGYYKYRVFDLPNTAYSIFMGGVEPYLKFEPLTLSCGMGLYRGSMWDEILGIDITTYKSHRGYSAWVSGGLIFSDNFELNAALRWHHFTEVDNKKLSPDEELSDDAIIIIKGIFSFNLL